MKDLKLIGKGAFTKAYLNDTDGRVYLVTEDPIKEVMAHGWFPDGDLFPEVKLEDNEMYSMEYYPKVHALKANLMPRWWKLYQELRTISVSVRNPYDAYSTYYKAIEETVTDEEFRGEILEALDACTNMGSDIYFEISPRNVAVKAGKLVLLDVFFQHSQLMKVRGIK